MTRWMDWRYPAGVGGALLLTAGAILLVTASHHPKAVIVRPVPRPTVRVQVTVRPHVTRTTIVRTFPAASDSPEPATAAHTSPHSSSHPTPRPTPKPTPTPRPTPTCLPFINICQFAPAPQVPS